MSKLRDTAWPRQVGNAIAVDTNYMRQIYIASPMAGLDSPAVRVNRYLRALELKGMIIKSWCYEGEVSQ